MSSEFSSDQAVMAAGNILVLPLHVTEEVRDIDTVNV